MNTTSTDERIMLAWRNEQGYLWLAAVLHTESGPEVRIKVIWKSFDAVQRAIMALFQDAISRSTLMRLKEPLLIIHKCVIPSPGWYHWDRSTAITQSMRWQHS